VESGEGFVEGSDEAASGPPPSWLPAETEMGRRIARHDWAATPLGPIGAWPPQLRTYVALMLRSAEPSFVAWGPERTWLYNDAFIPVAAERHPQALSRPAREVWAEAWDYLGPLFAQAYAGQPVRVDDLELQLQRNGVLEEAHWSFSYTPAPDAEGRIGGFCGVCTDITRQVGALRSAQLAEERLQLALAAGGGVGIWDWDVPGSVVIADARFAAIYGVDPERAARGAPIQEFFGAIHPDDLEDLHKLVNEALESRGALVAEYRLRQPDGEIRWVAARGRCLVGPDGKPLRFSGVTFDITDRKTAEARREALVTLGDRIRQIDDPEELAYVAAEILGRTLGVSRAGYGLVDMDAETIVIERDWNAPGIRTLAGRLHFRDYGSYIEDLAQGRTVVFEDAETDPRTRDNAEALKAISAQAVINMPIHEQGGLVALLYLNNATARAWSVEDMDLVREFADRTRTATERLRVAAALRDSEARLRQANETLEANVQARTEELMQAEAALRQAQKMEAVGQLTGGIAHDFNNLLGAIGGSLEMLEKRLEPAGRKGPGRYIAIAQESTRRAASLTQRLLAFARRQTLDSRPVDVQRMVEGMSELLRRSVGPSIDIRLDFAPDLWLTHLDGAQLENALLNLCINARDAMMPDGGAITIAVANTALDPEKARANDLPPGDYLALSVSDTGAGMSPEVIAKAFDPFFTTKPQGQGTGLGLSMVYGFVRQSGGQVRVFSAPGEGSEIRLYLPRHMGAVPEEDPAGAAPDTRQGGGETVLVVDDESAIRLLVREVLEDLGYEVREAADGAEALQRLARGPVDLLITDVGLPGGLNGRQVADAARARQAELKVLFITGYAESTVLGEGYLGPGMSVITKPFDLSVLGSKVHGLLGG
jgi:PAS domain S-box-containing protein